MFITSTNQVFDYHCETCGLVRQHLHPNTDVQVTADDLTITCPNCGAHEHWDHGSVPRLADFLGRDPKSLVGQVLDGGNVVVSDTRFELPTQAAAEARHLLRIRRALGLNDQGMR